MRSTVINKISLVGICASAITLIISGAVTAHVVVKPAEVVTAGFQTFTVGVPNEKDIPTTSVKLTIPAGLKYVSPTQKAGWQIETEKEGTGEESTIRSITWSGNTVDVGFRDEFTFSGQVPDKATDLQWKAYQTYADGSVVAWDQAETGSGHDRQNPNEGPFSVTKVVPESEETASIQKAEQAAADAKKVANRSLYIAIAGLVLSLISISLASRKKIS